MEKMLNVKSIHNGASKQSRPVVFEGSVKDGDDFRFIIAATDNAAFQGDVRLGSALLIGRGDDDYFNPEFGAVSPVFPVLPDDDKKIIAQQLRELADWFESQA